MPIGQPFGGQVLVGGQPSLTPAQLLQVGVAPAPAVQPPSMSAVETVDSAKACQAQCESGKDPVKHNASLA